jgi:hypothetical protein
MPRFGGGAPVPWVPGTYQQSSSIAQMLLDQGQQEAESTRATYGNIAGIVGQAGQAVQQYGEQRQAEKVQRAQFEKVTKQDETFMGILKERSAAGKPVDPAEILSIYGPGEKASKLVQGFASFNEIRQKQGAEALKLLPGVIEGMNALPEPARAEYYPKVRETVIATGVFPESAIKPEYSPETWESVKTFGSQLGEKVKAGVETVEILNPDGSKTIKFVDKKAGQEFTSAAPQAKPDTRSLEARLAAAPPDSPEAQQILETMRRQANATRAPKDPSSGPAGTWVEAVGADGQPVQLNTTTNQTRPYPEGVSPKATAKERAVTGVEKNVLNFYNRAQKALDDIAPLENKIADAGYMDQARLQYQGPGSNLLQSKDQQQYRQAQRSFTEARLRKDSGGAIKDEEYEYDAKTYFAQPGDEEPVRLQKKAARETILASLAYASGKAYEEYYGSPPPTPANPGGRKTGGPGAPAKKANPFR